jgi:hypothetical protein
MAANGECIRNMPLWQSVRLGPEEGRMSGESHPSWTARKEREKQAEKHAKKQGK